MVNAQEWLDREYPKERREEVMRILARSKKLEGELVIEGFSNLKRLEFVFNNIKGIKLIDLPSLSYFDAKCCHLESIRISGCPEIAYFKVNHNYLSSIDFLDDLNPEKLNLLSIHSNNFPKQDLSFLSKFVNLEKISIQNNYDEVEEFRKGIYNRFYGSLQPLQNLNKLKWLNITNTDVDGGLEYLPESVRKIGCGNSDWAGDIGCIKIREEIKRSLQVSGVTEKLRQEEEGEPSSAGDGLDYYRLAPWRQAQEILLEEKPLVKNLRKQIEELQTQIKELETKQNNAKGKNISQSELVTGKKSLSTLTKENKELKEELLKSKEVIDYQFQVGVKMTELLSKDKRTLKQKLSEIDGKVAEIFLVLREEQKLSNELFDNIKEKLEVSKWIKEKSNRKSLGEIIESRVKKDVFLEKSIIETQKEFREAEREVERVLDHALENLEEFQSLEIVDNVRNILLIGKTGGGKSTLANVLTNTDKFKESASSVSETRDIQAEEFEENGVKYRVIDTVGIGDTKLSKEEVLYKMSQATYLLRNGLNQVLFVTGGRFNKEEIAVYELLKGVVFDEDITDYTTIVRTRFPDFENEKECKKDKKALGKENKTLANIVTSSAEFIHIDNSSAEVRNRSRRVLLEHLASCQDNYKPQSLHGFVKKIKEPMYKIEELKQEKSDREKEIELVQERLSKGERKDDNGQELMQIMRILIEKQTKTEENMIKLVEATVSKTSQYMQEKDEEKGLLVRWLEILEDTTAEVKEVVQVATKCRIT